MDTFKRAEESEACRYEIVFSEHTNGTGRLFGGRLMMWMDTVAAVVGRRHSGYETTTASIAKVDFAVPAYLNDTVFIKGRLLSVGNTSMRVGVEAYVEKLSGEKHLINTAEFIMVAIGEDDRPTRVPRLK